MSCNISSVSKAAKLLTSKDYKNLDVTNSQFNELVKIYEHFDTHGETRMRKQAAFKRAAAMIEAGVEDLFVPRIIRSRKLGAAISLYRCVVLYGRAGYDKWNSYRSKQSETNTFEYKNKKYGMSKEELMLITRVEHLQRIII